VDVLSDTAQALISAGLDEAIVRRVIRGQRVRWGGGAVYVRLIDQGERKDAIRQAVARGLSPSRVASVVGCSDDTVRRVLARGLK
jgi:hypothetical protein